MVSKRFAVRWSIVALVVGAVLITLGMVVMGGAGHASGYRFGTLTSDGLFTYYIWDERQLMTGIVLALVGTAAIIASLTYMLLSRKGKGVYAEPSIPFD